MEQHSRAIAGGGAAPPGLGVEACVTLVAMLCALLALDDITTDNATTGFVPEYTLLAIAGAWLVIFAIQLWRKHRRVVAVVSLVVVAAAAGAAGDGLGHKHAGGWSVFWPEYSIITTAWLWFAAVSARLLVQAFRSAGPAGAPR